MKNLTFGICLLTFSMVASAQNVIVVAPTGGDFNNPVDALAAIGTTLPASSAGNRYLVKIAPVGTRYPVLS